MNESRNKIAKLLTMLLVTSLPIGTAKAANISDFPTVFSYNYQNDATVEMPGRLFVPTGYNPADTSTKYPLVVYFHGTGGRGTNNTSQVTDLSNNLVSNAKTKNFFILVPQINTSTWTPAGIDNAIRLVGNATRQYNINPSRIYITGYSLGGDGAWGGLSRHHAIAASVPIAGQRSAQNISAASLVGKAVWAFHAANDGQVDVSGTRTQVNDIRTADGGKPNLTFRLNASSSNPYFNEGLPYYTPASLGITYYEENNLRYTEYATGDHGIAGTVFNDQNMYTWLLSRVSTGYELQSGEAAYFDFGNTIAATPDSQGRTVTGGIAWNSFTNYGFYKDVNTVVPFAVANDGGSTNIMLEIGAAFGGFKGTGATTGAPFAASISADSWLTKINATATTDYGQLLVRGLEPGVSYNLEMYASVVGESDSGHGFMTRYAVGSTFVDFQAHLNVTGFANLNNISADSNGTIDLRVFATPGTSSRYGVINTLKVTKSAAVNQAPVAVNDSSSVNEGATATVTVLANDTDDGLPLPASLSITGLGTPAHGSASISGTQVQYTPAVGYYGADSFSYTISDGALTATATVSMTVNDTATAHNLSGAGLAGTAVGSGSSGSSRVLAGGDWEINAVGGALGSSADSLYHEQLSQSGNFQAVICVESLAGTSPARAGLVLREGTGAGAREVLVGTSPSGGVYVHANRTTVDAAATVTTSSTAYTYPNAWVMIERQGNLVKIATSPDDVTYTQLTTVTLTTLASSVNIGPFVTGGDSATSARAVMSGFEITALPTVVWALSCGKITGGEFTSLDDGTEYTSCPNTLTNPDGTTTNGTVYSLPNTLDDVLFGPYRYGNHTYNLAVPNGNYQVTLRFADNATSNGQRIFNVAIEGTTVLPNYDIRADAGTNMAINKVFNTTVTDGEVNIAFTNGSIGQAKIQAIVVKTNP